MVLLTFGIRIANKDSSPWHGAVTLYLAVVSTMMALYMHTQCVTTGAKELKITTRQQQSLAFTFTCRRRPRSKPSRE
jgi:hypothetical protein